MLRLILAAIMLFGLGISSAGAQIREVYTIRDIPVDEQASTVIEARERAMTAARIAGTRALINKITLAEDRAAVGGVPVDGALANRLTAAVDVEDEVAGAGRYRGRLAVVLNPAEVRAHLRSLGLPFLDTQAPRALLVPVAAPGLREALGEAFSAEGVGALVPYATAQVAYPAFASWAELAPEALQSGARRAIMAELGGREGAWRVTLSTVTAAGNEPVGATASARTLTEAARMANALLAEAWKRDSIVRDGSASEISAVVRYTSLAEWNTLRGALAQSPLVSTFRTRAVARDGALVIFVFAGDIARLRADLVQRGVDIFYGEDGYELRSAISPVAAP
jgi:hypothetical protein